MIPKALLFTSTLPYKGRKKAEREKGGRREEKRKGEKKGCLCEHEREREKESERK